VEFDEFSGKHRQAIDRRLEALLPAEDERPESLHRAMRYAVLSGGKRLRPLMTLAVAEAVGGNAGDALDAACAVELVHCFSLIHDDLPILDDDDLRRGLPTVHIAFNEQIALLAGDALFALAFETLANADASPAVRADGLALLAVASGTRGMVGGQTVDVESENGAVSLDVVDWIHRRKTGSLIEAAAGLGALFGGGSGADVERARRYGAELGLAFQIADDVLDETATTEDLGKQSRADRSLAKATYPSAIGVEGALELARQSADRALAEASGFAHREAAEAIARFAVERQS
jgi:geranylgeranyl diphosphate synthase type II